MYELQSSSGLLKLVHVLQDQLPPGSTTDRDSLIATCVLSSSLQPRACRPHRAMSTPPTTRILARYGLGCLFREDWRRSSLSHQSSQSRYLKIQAVASIASVAPTDRLRGSIDRYYRLKSINGTVPMRRYDVTLDTCHATVVAFRMRHSLRGRRRQRDAVQRSAVRREGRLRTLRGLMLRDVR